MHVWEQTSSADGWEPKWVEQKWSRGRAGAERRLCRARYLQVPPR